MLRRVINFSYDPETSVLKQIHTYADIAASDIVIETDTMLDAFYLVKNRYATLQHTLPFETMQDLLTELHKNYIAATKNKKHYLKK